METFYRLIWLFFCYSFLGWLLETAVAALREKTEQGLYPENLWNV